jgi:hypothetical protein
VAVVRLAYKVALIRVQAAAVLVVCYQALD